MIVSKHPTVVAVGDQHHFAHRADCNSRRDTKAIGTKARYISRQSAGITVLG